jgi:hypothetical protein
MTVSGCAWLTLRPLTGYWYRAVSLKHWDSRLSSDQSRITRSRFSSGTASTPLYRIIYLGETHQVAIHEVRALLGDPSAPIANSRGSWAILSLNVVLDQIVDLSESSEQRLIATNQSELTGNWRNHPGVPPTHELGHALYSLPGLEGFLYKSSLLDALCLAVFPDKLGPRSSIIFENEITGKRERLS